MYMSRMLSLCQQTAYVRSALKVAMAKVWNENAKQGTQDMSQRQKGQEDISLIDHINGKLFSGGHDALYAMGHHLVRQEDPLQSKPVLSLKLQSGGPLLAQLAETMHQVCCKPQNSVMAMKC